MALASFRSKIIADVGITMGDEGKGRLVAELVEELQQSTGATDPVGVVLKTNGGANSGHTAGGLKFNLLPCGVITESVDCLAIASGVVADPRKFWWEIRPLEAQGHNVLNRLLIDQRTQLSDLSHRLLDLAWEYYRSEILKQTPRGSTGRGITPAYVDEVGQCQIFYDVFLGPKEHFAECLRERMGRAVRTIQHVCQASEEAWDGFFDTLSEAEARANSASIADGIFPAEEFDFSRFRNGEPFTLNEELLIDTYWEAGAALGERIGDVRDKVLDTTAAGRSVICEFGQAYWLDKRHGFPPNVTASHTYVPEIFQSAGIPLQPVHTVGVCKAYDTKVGTHVFLTEMPDTHPLAAKLKELEYGTSTGRQRMVGWFDAVEKADALRYGGFDDLMINKLDALTYSGSWEGGELLICVGYRDSTGKTFTRVPRSDQLRTTLQPVYQQLPGWSEDISKVRRFDDLPANAKRYVATLMAGIIDLAYGENRPGTLPNLRYIGVGPDPSQIIKDVPPTPDLLAAAS